MFTEILKEYVHRSYFITPEITMKWDPDIQGVHHDKLVRNSIIYEILILILILAFGCSYHIHFIFNQIAYLFR